MKLIRFTSDGWDTPRFGVVINRCAVAFSALLERTGSPDDCLRDSRAKQ
jgi:hypothetical protein